MYQYLKFSRGKCFVPEKQILTLQPHDIPGHPTHYILRICFSRTNIFLSWKCFMCIRKL